MKVFISYRREDSAGHTGRLYDSLRGHIGTDNIFLDLSGIDSGQNFVDVIRTAINSSDVMLAIVGSEWLTCASNNRRRLDDPGDLVRTEIVTALQHGLPVIPVLVNKAAPPPAAMLPEGLKPLAAIDAHELSDERWDYDVERLIAAIRKLAHTRRHETTRRYWLVAAAALLVAAALVGLLVWRHGASPTTETLAGDWSAPVAYEWGAKYTERMHFIVEGAELLGTASFLGAPRAIVNGRLDGDRVTFETRTQEVSGSEQRDVVHRYRGRIDDMSIVFVMQSEGGASQAPVQFTARRQ